MGKTVRQLEDELSPIQLTEYHAYYDPKTWQGRIANTEAGRSAQIMQLVLGGKNGK